MLATRALLKNLSFNRLNPIFYTPLFNFSEAFQQLKNSEITFNLLFGRLGRQVKTMQQKQIMLNQQNFVGNKDATRRQIAKMMPLFQLHQKIQSHQQNLKDLAQMIKETTDPAQQKLLKEQQEQLLEQFEQFKEECWTHLIPPTPYDDASQIVLQFRPGAGGAQSSIFVEDISGMYESFCSSMGWRCWITNQVKETGVSRGFKALDMKVQGQEALKIMKCEAGVHKVIRVPQTEAKGRVHSSTISMVVMPVVPFTFEVDSKDIKYQFTRSSGPGGQAVNKIESACRAIHIPTNIQVFIQEQRSQQQNKKRATQLLKQKIFEIQYKKAMDDQQSRRKSQVTTLDRSEKIRTYNYPQDRITDHRTGLTKFGIEKMMGGEFLQEFISAYNQKLQQQKTQALIEELYAQAGIAIPAKK